jgi:BirA family biotin operon repressor/biotin-[acetyl-CoA-carboxylase] ligase
MYSLRGFEVWEFPELESTNAEAGRRAGEMKDRSVIVTGRQTRGRGQEGNSWESEPGKNICMTVVFRPRELPAGEQFAISMVVALGTRDLVARHVEGCTIKWPNDIYAGDRKIAGVLIEHVVTGNTISLSLCGVGLNVNQTRFTSDAPNPVSLALLTGGELSTRQVLEELLAAIDGRYRSLPDARGLRRDYLAALYRREGTHAWEDREGRFRASIRGVDAYGQLVLEDEGGGQRVYGFKEVKHVLI